MCSLTLLYSLLSVYITTNFNPNRAKNVVQCILKIVCSKSLLDLLHVTIEGLEVSELSILFLGAADVEKQLAHLTPDVRSLVSHHVFAKNKVPFLKW
jgi:hypothetical protein